jgi:hypothetical protein
MLRPLYETQDGRKISKLGTSRHHIFWERKDYHTPQEKRFREAAGMVLRLEQTVHRELHEEIAPPPKPSHDFMNMITDFKRGIPTYDTYEMFEYITEYVGGVSCSQNRHAVEAGKLFDNFAAQQHFINLGKVTLCS